MRFTQVKPAFGRAAACRGSSSIALGQAQEYLAAHHNERNLVGLWPVASDIAPGANARATRVSPDE